MELSISQQVLVFVSCWICGIVLGVLFDVFRIFRKTISSNDWWVYIQDILFWLVASFIVFAVLLYINNAQIRVYEFLAVILGGVFYFLCFSRLIMSVSVTLINFIKFILTWIIKIILFPVVLIYKIMKKPFIFFGVIGKKAFKNMSKRLKSKPSFIKRIKLKLRKI